MKLTDTLELGLQNVVSFVGAQFWCPRIDGAFHFSEPAFDGIRQPDDSHDRRADFAYFGYMDVPVLALQNNLRTKPLDYVESLLISGADGPYFTFSWSNKVKIKPAIKQFF